MKNKIFVATLLLIVLSITSIGLNSCLDYCETMYGSKDCNFAERTIEILNPLGGEKWEIGSTQKIQWEYTGEIEEVKIELCDVDGVCEEIITTSSGTIEGDGYYNWKVNDSFLGSYILRISDAGNSNKDPVIAETESEITIYRDVNTIALYINNGDVYTTSSSVILSITGVFGNGEMRFSNNQADLDSMSWEQYESIKFWDLIPEDGEQTVYGQFKDMLGNITDVDDSIILDITSPTATLSNTPPEAPDTTDVTEIDIIVGGADVVSYKYNLNVNNNGWTGWSDEIALSNHITETDLPDGLHQLKVVGKDESGNWQSFMDATVCNWIVDAITPTGSLIIDNGNDYTNNASVMLNIVGASDGQQMRFSNTSDFSGVEWETFSSIRNWVLSTGDGIKTVYGEIKDSSGEVITIDDTIELDTTPPNVVLSNTPSDPDTTGEINITVGGGAPGTGDEVIAYKYNLNINNTGWTGWTDEIPVSNPITATDLPDGSHQLKVVGRDTVGNWLSYFEAEVFTWVVNAVNPNGTFTINNNDAFTNSVDVNLSMSITTTGSRMRFSNDDVSWSSWENYNTSKSWILITGDEMKTVYCEIEDDSGEVISLMDNITLDTTPPEAELFNLPPEYTEDRDIAISVGGVDVEAYKYNMNINGSGWTGWSGEIPITTNIVENGLLDAYHQIKVIGRDEAGNWQSFANETAYGWTVDATAPSGSLLINDNDDYTNSTEVTLTLVNVTDCLKMRFSDTPIADTDPTPAWEDFWSTKSWTLPDGDGEKIVYCQLKDNEDHLIHITSIQDSIELDTQSPTAELSNTPTTTDPHITQTDNIDITVGGDGVVAYKYNMNINETGWTGWTAERPISSNIQEDNLADGYYQLKVVGRDEAGNWQSYINSTNYNWYIDTNPPTGTFVINGDNTYTTDADVTLNIDVTDDTANVVDMRFSQDGTFDTELWVGSYSDTHSITLTGGEGTNTVWGQFRDDIGNETTEEISDDIILDLGSTQIIYVKTTGNDDNPGTQTEPMRTIQGAIDYAYNNYPRASIYVAAGTYNEAITMKNNISIYGGYSASNWGDRDIDDRDNPTYKTLIESSTSDRIVYLGGEINVETIIEGFTIVNSMPDVNSYGIYNLSEGNNLSVLNCTIDGSSAEANGFYAYGVYNSGSIPNVQNCEITGSTGYNSYGYALYYYRNPDDVSNAAIVSNNTISGGDSYSSYGVYNNAASVVYENNTITGATASSNRYAYAMWLNSNPTPRVEVINNTIEGSSGVTYYDSYGIRNRYCYSLIENNTITGGSGTVNRYSYGLEMYSSNATIRNNTIEGGNGLEYSYGVYTRYRTPVFEENFIDGGTGKNNSYGMYNTDSTTAHITGNKIYGGNSVSGSSYAIYNDSADPYIVSNLISGGTSNVNASSFGIYNYTNSKSYIINNTISGGLGGSGSTSGAYGIYLKNDDVATKLPTLYNNIIFTIAGTERFGIYENDAYSDPIYFKHNDIFDCPTGLYSDIDNSGIRTNLSTIADINDYDLTTQNANSVEGNTSINANFSDIDGADNDVQTLDDNDWHLSGSTDVSIVNGGMNLESDSIYCYRDASDNPIDMDKNARTPAPPDSYWSMGAYEYD